MQFADNLKSCSETWESVRHRPAINRQFGHDRLGHAGAERNDLVGPRSMLIGSVGIGDKAFNWSALSHLQKRPGQAAFHASHIRLESITRSEERDPSTGRQRQGSRGPSSEAWGAAGERHRPVNGCSNSISPRGGRSYCPPRGHQERKGRKKRQSFYSDSRDKSRRGKRSRDENKGLN